MKKRILSLILSLITLFSLAAPCTANAASFEEALRADGFTESYIDQLSALHKKYPNWEFKAFRTGLDWSTAVAGERSRHRNQIIEKTSAYGDIYYCNCSECKPNGKYRYQYGSCVSASKWAVEYFMDPRNWLDEKHIFQFQSNVYSGADTQSGVEAILKPTWMHNANIVYNNTEGKEVSYISKKGNPLKYSKGIMLAAQKSGAGAYYLASRIVKEVGASKPSATGVCGTKKPFVGIYNYYSIGASSGAMSGLEFASGYLKTEQKTTLYSDYDAKNKKGSGTKTKVASGQYMSYISAHGDYYKVRLYSDGYKSGAVGYILKSALRTKYFNYNRPWTNPYKSILGGAQYIAANYLKYQYTSYMEKFNVNAASGSLYTHEYMQNVDAVSTEAVSTYNAYKAAGVLSSKHIFYIPVFSNMPGDTGSGAEQPVADKPSRPKLTFRNTSSMSFRWNGVSGAEKYYVLVRNLTKNTTFTKTVNSPSATIKGLTAGNRYKIRVRAYAGGKWGSYSKALTARAVPMRAKLKSLTSPSSGKLYAAWSSVSGANGYQLKYARDKKFKNTVANKLLSGSQTSYTGKGFTKGVTYYVKVRAYTVVEGKRYYGSWSSVKSVKSK